MGTLLMFDGTEAVIPPNPRGESDEGLSEHRARRAAELVAELASRKRDALKLYEPLPAQDAFHACMASERLIRKGNRSGGTVAGAVEFARAALGLDPYNKFPTNRPLLLYCITYDQDQIGRVFYRYLFKGGAFKIIPDEVSGEWRAYRPATDEHRAGEARPAPPLIPKRYLSEEIGWVNKKERIWSVARIKRGDFTCELRAFGSKSSPAQGDPVDGIWVDEDLYDEGWLTEMYARLADTKGRLWWTALPHSHNDAMMSMTNRAEEQVGSDNPTVVEFRLSFTGNPHIDEDEKKKQYERWAAMSEDERRMRDWGEYLTDSVLTYPEFSTDTHGTPAPPGEADTPLDEAIRKNNGRIPADWCRYVFVDPGHTVCAALFLAVPPPKLGDYVVAYDELWIRNSNAIAFGKKMLERVGGDVFQAFVIDDHGSRQHGGGVNLTLRQQYSAEMKRHNIRSVATGHGFHLGSDDREARTASVHLWMASRDDGTTRFKILVKQDELGRQVSQLPHLAECLKKWLKQRTRESVSDTGDGRSKWAHLPQCLEYAAAYNPRYHKPKPGRVKRFSPAYASHLEWDQDERRQNRKNSMSLGPGVFT